jgi:MATE family multidrug resistance protein
MGVLMALDPLVAQAVGAEDHPAIARALQRGLVLALGLTVPCGALLLTAQPFLTWIGEPRELVPAAALFARIMIPSVAPFLAFVVFRQTLQAMGRMRAIVMIIVLANLLNGLLDWMLIFGRLGAPAMGVAGSAWATGAAQLVGLGLGMSVFLSSGICREFSAHRCWRPDAAEIRRVVALGLPMGLLPAVDLIGLALFQAMQASLGAVAGAATQIVMMMTSIAYMPAIGIASAGTTLVGQSIGAGNRQWATRVGNASIMLTVAYMGLVSVALALAGPWLLPLFLSGSDPHAAQVLALGYTLLWIGAAYQIFDGFNLGAGFCLRGAGDVRVPALIVVFVSWFCFVPLAHMLSFAPGQGWVELLPQFGFGAAGGWSALLVYTFALATAMYLRWRSGAWRKISLA